MERLNKASTLLIFSVSLLISSCATVDLLNYRINKIPRNESFLNEPNGFRGIPWGTYRSEIEGNFVHIDGNTFCGEEWIKAEKQDEDFSIDGLTLNSIHYDFLNGKLGSVSIRIDPKKNKATFWDDIIAIYFKRHGIVEKRKDEFTESYKWSGHKTEIILRQQTETIRNGGDGRKDKHKKAYIINQHSIDYHRRAMTLNWGCK